MRLKVDIALRRCARVALVLLCAGVVASCESPWNRPYSQEFGNALYSSFAERPKFLDPGRSYSSNEYVFLAQVYEPPLQYHPFVRPYQLQPLTLRRMPEVVYEDANGARTADATKAARTIYRLELQPDILYQPHPAFARRDNVENLGEGRSDSRRDNLDAGQGASQTETRDANQSDAQGENQHKMQSGGQPPTQHDTRSNTHPPSDYLYHNLPDTADYRSLADFAHHATRELTAADYVYQLKRLADPKTHCPIAKLLSTHIVGFAELRKQLTEKRARGEPVDLRDFQLAGVRAIGRYTYEIEIKRSYPQFIYWLAMPFFSPMPWEADAFYDQDALKAHNVVLNWYPIGTGAYMLTENNPNLRMTLSRNPNYRLERYPSEGEPSDIASGLLNDAGKPMPFIDRAVFSLEKESIPYWNKFLQGYYDVSGVSSDSFDQALQVSNDGEFNLSQSMLDKGIRLTSVVQASIIYIGFNMQDAVVGGDSERARKLRQALSIALDMEEFISIFLNGRGVVAQGPIPPGIFGHRDGAEGLNYYTHNIRQGDPKRRPLSDAVRLMAEAGYANGIDSETGEPLTLYFDTTGGGPDARAFLNWMRKQFAKLKIQLVVRSTDYNRFQQKVRQGSAQIFRWGWNADYPDPENFLFLFYGPHSKVRGGENATNYENAEFDRLFKQLETMPNGRARALLIDRAVGLLRHDSPWIWGFHPKAYSLHHAWLKNVKPNLMGRNTLKYRRIDVAERERSIQGWNQPNITPLLAVLIALILLLAPAVRAYIKRRNQPAIRPD